MGFFSGIGNGILENIDQMGERERERENQREIQRIRETEIERLEPKKGEGKEEMNLGENRGIKRNTQSQSPHTRFGQIPSVDQELILVITSTSGSTSQSRPAPVSALGSHISSLRSHVSGLGSRVYH